MNRKNSFFRYILTTLLAIVLLFSTGYTQEENFCYITTNRNVVYVVIYELDRQGNRGDIIFGGWIEDGERIPIEAEKGAIRYNYKLTEEGPLSGDVSRWCINGNDILVP